MRRNGKLYVMEFERGKAVSDLMERGAANRTGTKISFWPDPDLPGGLRSRRYWERIGH